VVTVFPKGCFKYRRVILSAAAAALKGKAGSACPFKTKRTIYRWRTRFRGIAKKHLRPLIRFILQIHPEVDVKTGTVPQPLEYLLQLISQFNPSHDVEILVILLELQNAGMIWK